MQYAEFAAHVKMVGYVEDLTPLLSSCKVFVAPVRYGAGLKGKVGMAMAAGLPVVTSSIGAEGIDGENELLLVSDEPKSFAGQVVRVYQDRKLWARLARNAKSWVQHKYSFEAVEKTLREILDAPPRNMRRRLWELAENKVAALTEETVSDPLGGILSKYYSREDLQEAYPEVKHGDYRRLAHWATSSLEGDAILRIYRDSHETELIDELRVRFRKLGLALRAYGYVKKFIKGVFPDGTSRGDVRRAVVQSLRESRARRWRSRFRKGLTTLSRLRRAGQIARLQS